MGGFKGLNISQKLGTRNTLSLSHSLFFDMLNNFCFHIQLVGSICTKSCVHHEKVAVPHFSRVLYILRKWPGNGILGALDQ